MGLRGEDFSKKGGRPWTKGNDTDFLAAPAEHNDVWQ